MKLYAYHLVGSKAGKVSLKRNFIYLEKIMPTLIEIGEDGALMTKNLDIPQTENIYPLVQNKFLSTEVTNKFLSDENFINNAIEELINYLDENKYNGINLDLEGVKKKNKEAYHLFIKKLKEKMKNKYKLDLSIPAKTENHIDTGWAGAYDYKYLGQIADNINIMAYDYHWSGGMPGPIAPLSWVYNVIDYAIMEIKAEKVLIGLAAYGYDWVIEPQLKKARGLSYKGILALMEKMNIRAEWDQESETPYFKYEDEEGLHEVWYENELSLKKKINLIKKFQIKGGSLWRLGLEDPKFWNHL